MENKTETVSDNWISVKDKSPNHNEVVTVRSDQRSYKPRQARYTDFKYSEYDTGFRDENIDPVHVTHWQPLNSQSPAIIK